MIQIKGEFKFIELENAGLFDLDTMDSKNSKNDPGMMKEMI